MVRENNIETTNFIENPEMWYHIKIFNIIMKDEDDREEETMRFKFKIILNAMTANTHTKV